MANVKTYIAVGVLALLIIVALVITFLTDSKPGSNPQTTPQPTANLNDIPSALPSAGSLPTLPPQQGGGVDIKEPVVVDSTKEIEKLYLKLPYQNHFLLSTGQAVDVFIPGKDLQTTQFSLIVEIDGLNYNVKKGEPDYDVMKKSFKEVASRIFGWIKEQGIDPSKIVFIWGERAFIQEKSLEWLTAND